MIDLTILTNSPWLRPSRIVASFALMFGGILVALLLRSPPLDGEQAAIQRLPAPERHALYERTRLTLQADCEPAVHAPGLEQFCREQARFIRKFSECDAACRALAAPYRPMPSRALQWGSGDT